MKANLFVKIYLFILSYFLTSALISNLNNIITIIFNILIFIYNVIYNPTPIVLNKFYLISTLISLILVLQVIIIMCFMYLIHNKKLTKSIFKPSFLNKYIEDIESLSNSDNLKILIDFYYKVLYFYLFTLILGTSCYYFKFY